MNKAPEADAVVNTANRLVGLEFDECEHFASSYLGMGALNVAATMQWTNVLGIFISLWGSPARLGYIGGTTSAYDQEMVTVLAASRSK